MGLLRLAAVGALGYVGFKWFEKSRTGEEAAFGAGQGTGENFAKIRDAGPAAMADTPQREWTKTDQESDESFPASDPPSNY